MKLVTKLKAPERSDIEHAAHNLLRAHTALQTAASRPQIDDHYREALRDHHMHLASYHARMSQVHGDSSIGDEHQEQASWHSRMSA